MNFERIFKPEPVVSGRRNGYHATLLFEIVSQKVKEGNGAMLVLLYLTISTLFIPGLFLVLFFLIFLVFIRNAVLVYRYEKDYYGNTAKEAAEISNYAIKKSLKE